MLGTDVQFHDALYRCSAWTYEAHSISKRERMKRMSVLWTSAHPSARPPVRAPVRPSVRPPARP